MTGDLPRFVLNERYEVTRQLGAGGFGIVLQAHDQLLDREVAVKFIRPGYALTPLALEAFLREARTIARLDHPNIVTVYDLGAVTTKEGSLLFLVMQLATGGSLADRLKDGPLALHEAQRVLTAICAALDYAHRRGVIHLDMKPLNILFDEHDNPLVGDFGLAKLLEDATRVKADTRSGTLAYMAPEQLFGSQAGPFTDVYALGISLYEMLAGQLPRRAWSGAVFFDRPVAEDWMQVINRATQADPALRYKTVSELAAVLASSQSQPAEKPLRRVEQVRPVHARTPLAVSPPPVVRTASRVSRVEDLLPPPFEWIDIPAGKVRLEKTRRSAKDIYLSEDQVLGLVTVIIVAAILGLTLLMNFVRGINQVDDGRTGGEILCISVTMVLGLSFFAWLVWGLPEVRRPPRKNSALWQWVAGDLQRPEVYEEVMCPAFAMAKYPITNAQYQTFVDAEDGYRDPSWWGYSPQAIAWRRENVLPHPGHFPGPTRPRETVSWYEAVAFCRWLSKATGETITLPTEQQWQRAAQGSDGRGYPWGNKFYAQRCNTTLNQFNGASVVDSYPSGASPFGVMDMAGNVWEWCLNQYDSPTESSLQGYAPRALRGGAWDHKFSDALCEARKGDRSDKRGSNGGFRIVRVLRR